MAESSILQNRHGTRYLMFDDAATIADVFALRCRTSPNAPAYRQFDSGTTEWIGIDWREAGERVARMREGLRREGLQPGARIAVMLKNSINWVVADQGAFVAGLVTVPVFVDDRPDNVAYILNDADVKLIVIDGEEHWKRLKTVRENLGSLQRILTVKPVNDPDEPRLALLADWLSALTTAKVKLAERVTAEMPVIAPVAVLRLSPVGSAGETLQVSGVNPPVLASVCE